MIAARNIVKRCRIRTQQRHYADMAKHYRWCVCDCGGNGVASSEFAFGAEEYERLSRDAERTLKQKGYQV